MKVKYDEYDIYYEVHGNGKPLIVLNGIMMSSLSWHQFIEPLKDYQLIFIDFIDQGQSTNGMQTTHSMQVQVVKTVVDHLKLKEVNLIGVSYGAQIAMQYAIKYEVNQLMICNAALYTTPWLSDIGRAWVLAASHKDPELFYHVTIPYIYSHHFYNKNNSWMRERKEVLLDVFNESFMNRMKRLIDSSEGYDIREAIKNVKAKVHVVASQFDYLTPADQTQKIFESIEGATFSFLENCGHASMYEMPDDFVKMIKDHFV